MTTSNGSQALLNTLEILKGKIDTLVARNESLLLRNSFLEEENRDLRRKLTPNATAPVSTPSFLRFRTNSPMTPTTSLPPVAISPD